DRWQPGQGLGREADRGGQSAVRAQLGQEYRAHDADRHADEPSEPHHDQCPDDGVAESAAHLEAGRRQLDQHAPVQPGAAAHDEHVEDRAQRNAREDRRRPGACGEHLAHERAPLERSSLEARGTRPGSDRRARLDPGLERASRAGAHRTTFRPAMAMIAPPATLTSKVMASRTSAAYISTETSRGPASGKFSASNAARVLAGEKSERLSWFELPISIASAMVSPSARPKPSTSAPKIPVAAVGSMTFRIASHRVVPMP